MSPDQMSPSATESTSKGWLRRLFEFGGSVTSLAVVGSTVILVLALIADLRREVVVLESFKVATSLDAAPTENSMLSEQLLRDMRQIVQKAQTGYEVTQLRPHGFDRLANVQVPSELGVAQSLLVTLRDALGYEPTRVHLTAVGSSIPLLAEASASSESTRADAAKQTARESWTVGLRLERAQQYGGEWAFEIRATALRDAIEAAALPLLDQLDPFVVSVYMYATAPEAWDAKVVPRLGRMLGTPPAHDDAWAHNLWGVRELKDGSVDSAINHFRQATTIDPRLPVAHYNLGLALAGRDAPFDYGEAVVEYGRAFHSEAWLRARAAYNVALLHVRHQRLREADKALAIALSTHPAFSEAHAVSAHLRALNRDLAGVNRSYRLAVEFGEKGRRSMLLRWAQTLDALGDQAAAPRYQEALVAPGALTSAELEALCDRLRQWQAPSVSTCEQQLAALTAHNEE
jgi:Tfp pilus assembly protein PilF